MMGSPIPSVESGALASDLASPKLGMQSNRVPSGLTTVGFLAVIVLGSVLRIHGLADLPFEQDELYTLRDAINLGASAGTGPGIAGRPLYYLLQHVLLLVAPATPLVMRVPAFLFGVAGIWATWRLGRSWFGSTAGLVGAVLLATSPWHLYASQFARYWTLVYLLAALVYDFLPRAMDSDRHRQFGAVFLIVTAGALTHPTFAFPLVGVILALHTVARDGRIGWRWPSPNAWVGLWGPLFLVLGMGFVVLKLTGNDGALHNWSGRGLVASIRLVPAMVQWMGAAVATAAVVGVLLLAQGPPDRRAAVAAGAGALATIGLLLVASFSTDVYADYGMAMLPLVYVSAGGMVQRAAEAAADRVRWLAPALTSVLVLAVLPSTASHLSDGTRFDYRPAFEYVRTHGPDRLVLGWPTALQRYYAPELQFEELTMKADQLEDALLRTNGFFLLASMRRYGIVSDSGPIARWIDLNCRRRLATERPRLDYRRYRVELYWCEPRVAG